MVKLDEEDEDDSNAAAFYLRHQNRALASELRHLKCQLYRMERERSLRRDQCSKASQALHTLHATWTHMEKALRSNAIPVTSTIHPADIPSTETTTTSTTSTLPNIPLSTGSGASVELVNALWSALSALGQEEKNKNDTRAKKRTINSGDQEGVDDEMDWDGQSTPTSVNGTSSSHPEDQNQSMAATDSDSEEAEASALSAAELQDLSRISDGITKRATTLQDWIFSLLQRLENAPTNPNLSTDDTLVQQQQQQQQKKIAYLKGKNETLKAQVKELARSRDELADSDRRVRRGLYRLAAGRIQLKEVLKAIVVADEDKGAMEPWMDANSTAAADSGDTSGYTTSAYGGVSSSTATAALSELDNAQSQGEQGDNKDSTAASSAEVAQLIKKVSDLEQISSVRDEQIKKLLTERETLCKRINNLVMAANENANALITDDDIKKTDLYVELTTKLATAERTVQEVQQREERMKEEWSQALATAESAQETIKDLHAKHLKRWTDMVEEYPHLENGDDGAESSAPNNATQAEENITLQHKLTQALENVRQAEHTRKTLQEAIAMNEGLQAKLDEVKTKYAALQHSRANSNNNSTNSGSGGNNSTAAPGSSGNDGLTTPKPKASSSSTGPSSEKMERSEKSEKSAEKLHREYRRIQKQLAAATASKEAAKAKLERTEKERESLNSTNARLLRQVAEKDEMNAKSLSTILHLKQLTEQITKEKENLEQQVKSAQQLALAARLAANARDRLSEEAEKERLSVEARVQGWEEKCETLQQQKEQLESRIEQEKSKMSALTKDIESAKVRCEELATESTKLHEERQKMAESLAIAQQEAEKAIKQTERLAKASGGGIVEGFTAEQLHLQVKHLQGRLNCPVCNVRDKKCILLRCRHMFCKNCVDENIKNRSRKCPACGIRFDTKDVADIWL